MGFRIFMANCTNQLLREISWPYMKRRDVAKTYALAMKAEAGNGEVVDWREVNEAIIARWSPYALKWIKEQAHSGRCFEPRLAIDEPRRRRDRGRRRHAGAHAMTTPLPPGPTTPRRITVEMVMAAKERHPEIRVVRNRWVGRERKSRRLCACPASLLAIDKGRDAEQIKDLEHCAVRVTLDVEDIYLSGFIQAIDGSSPVGWIWEGDQNAYELGYSDGEAVVAALWPDEPTRDRREAAP